MPAPTGPLSSAHGANGQWTEKQKSNDIPLEYGRDGGRHVCQRGYAAWGSTFYQTVRGMSAKSAGLWIGGLTAIAGLLGIACGTWFADFLLKFTRRAYLLMRAREEDMHCDPEIAMHVLS
ncbi:hypothetical protein SAMN05444166_8169 [Singulisphaera sp. GP187]|uniref:hypothetical protein n=1 Tax=Singulisphaera sp. GP187 TaxID=1882752 RepID=UPI000929E0D4|nr:hypothetical protein [Singulisphaera sp. GP187]SIO66658.1 hypothetical protein SAMN05444166_8169 [Singulisphaera sp. GP187]